jgi:hypothetical protein
MAGGGNKNYWGLTGAGGHATLFSMKPTTLQKLAEIVESSPRNAMRNRTSRRKLALRMAHELNMWEEFTLSFVEEMEGLNFRQAEDRKLFLQFAETAF